MKVTAHKSDHNHRLCIFRKIPHKVRIGLGLQRSISFERIRRDLAVAQAYGLDPREVYEECVQELRNRHTKQSFPQYCEVEPSPIMTNDSVSDSPSKLQMHRPLDNRLP
jgi:hypothetical protein